MRDKPLYGKPTDIKGFVHKVKHRHSPCRASTKISFSRSCLFFVLYRNFMKENETQRFHVQLQAILMYSFEFKMKISTKFSLSSLDFYFGHSRLHSWSCKHLMHVLNFVQPFDPCNHKSLLLCVNIWRTRHVRVAICVYSVKWKGTIPEAGVFHNLKPDKLSFGAHLGNLNSHAFLQNSTWSLTTEWTR